MQRTGRALGQNLLHEVQSAIEAKPILASSPFAQRKAFLTALRADMMAHMHDLVRANRHDCEAFTQELQTPMAMAAAGSSSLGTPGTSVPMPAASLPPLAASQAASGGGGVAARVSSTMGSVRGVANAGVGGMVGHGSRATPLSSPSPVEQALGQRSYQPPPSEKASDELAPIGEVLGPFYQAAFTSRPSHRQRLFPLRFDKVFSVIDFLLEQPDPIAIPSDCWLNPLNLSKAHLRRNINTVIPEDGDNAGQGEEGACDGGFGQSWTEECTTSDGAPPRRSLRTNADPDIEVCEIRVPLGLVGVLSRYRPRMLLDATTMGVFAGNALLLDGGAALHCTNAAVMRCVTRALRAVGLPTAAIVHVESYDVHNQQTAEWLHMADRVDVGLVCGPPKLYEFACRNSSIPLIRATSRSCSLFVHESASYDTALRVILNAKRQSAGAANSVTTVILHSKFPRYVELLKDLVEENVLLLGDYAARGRAPECIHEIASDEEYRGLSQGLRDFSNILCIKTVDNIDQALFFLDLFGSKQTDGIIANDETAIADFCTSADSAVVLVNASTRLSSGNPLGCGPDLAIATSKAHCRGPFTLSALTTRKFIVRAKHEDGALRR